MRAIKKKVYGRRRTSTDHSLSTSGLVVVDVDSLELQVMVAAVGARGVDAVFVTDNLPEL